LPTATFLIGHLLNVATQQASLGGRIDVRSGEAGYLEERRKSNWSPRPE
jgi:hypothetical protein